MYRRSLISLVISGILWLGVDSRADQLSRSRSTYIQELETVLSKGIELRPNTYCTSIPEGSQTTLLNELVILDADGVETLEGCTVALGIRGPIVVPAQNLKYLGCTITADIKSRMENFENYGGSGMFFELETGHTILIRCGDGYHWQWADLMKESGQFSPIRVFPKVIGGSPKQSSEMPSPDGFPFDG